MGGGGFLQLGEETEPSISIVNLLSSSAFRKGVSPLRWSPENSRATQAWRDLIHSIQLQNQPLNPFWGRRTGIFSISGQHLPTWPAGSIAVSPPQEQPVLGYGISRMDPSRAMPPPGPLLLSAQGLPVPSRSCQTLPRSPGRSFQAPSARGSSLGLTPQLEAEPQPCPWH